MIVRPSARGRSRQPQPHAPRDGSAAESDRDGWGPRPSVQGGCWPPLAATCWPSTPPGRGAASLRLGKAAAVPTEDPATWCDGSGMMGMPLPERGAGGPGRPPCRAHRSSRRSSVRVMPAKCRALPRSWCRCRRWCQRNLSSSSRPHTRRARAWQMRGEPVTGPPPLRGGRSRSRPAPGRASGRGRRCTRWRPSRG